jgi:hypothetical protein
MLASYDDIYIVSTAKAVIKYRQEAVGVWRQVYTHYIRLFIYDMVYKSRVLMSESVMVLLPDMRGK